MINFNFGKKKPDKKQLIILSIVLSTLIVALSQCTGVSESGLWDLLDEIQRKYFPQGILNELILQDPHAVERRVKRDVDRAIDEVTPEIGDLVCAPRQSGVTYDTTDNYISHCDLVVAKRTNEIDIIGGNVSDSVTQKTLKLDTNGKVKDTTRPWFVVIKNLL
jgi:hypothetical protein